jgi:heat shock protein HtpX
MFFGGSRDSAGARAAKMILFVLQFVLPLITGVLSMFLSRTREYMADAGSVEITGDKKAMANALIKIHNNYADEPHEDEGAEFRRAAYIYEPKSFASLFSTHPSLQDRLRALGFEA